MGSLGLPSSSFTALALLSHVHLVQEGRMLPFSVSQPMRWQQASRDSSPPAREDGSCLQRLWNKYVLLPPPDVI